jgi:phage terminase large subunit
VAEINFNIPSKLLYFINEKARYKVSHGGRGAGKSWAVAACLIVRAFQGKEKILCTRAYQNSILDSVHSLLTGAITRLGLVDYFTITKTSIRTNFRGSPELESEFIFKGLQNNIDEIKSMEGITICWVEEAHSIDASGWNILIPTIRFENSEIWISFNARYATDATYQMFVQRFENIKEYDPAIEYNENSLVRIDNRIYISLQPCNKGLDFEAAAFKERWKLYAIFQKVNYYDNPFFSKTELAAEMELCKQMNYDEYLHIWEGNPKTESNAIVFKDRYKIEPFEQHPIEMMLKKRIFAGMDFGWNDPTTYVECYIIDTTLYIIREAYKTQVLLDDLVGFLQEAVPDILQRKPLIYGDSSRPDIIKKLANEGLRIKSVKKTTVSQDPLEKQKSDGYVKSGIDFIRRFNIIIHPRCVKTIEEFQNYKYEVKEDEAGNEIVLDKFVDKWNHCIDATRYALAELISKPRSTMADIAHSIMARKANK